MAIRVIAFVDHEIGFRLLQKLILSASISEFELVAVVTTTENGQMWWPGVDGLCDGAGIPLYRYEEPFSETLDYENIDWYLLLSWKHIIPESLIKHPSKGVVNLHYSLLPEYRGVYPVNWAIIEGKAITGVSYHYVNNKIDSGEIILQKDTSISLSDTSRSLQLRLDDLAYELFDDLVDWIVGINQQKKIVELKPFSNEGRHCYKSKKDFDSKREIDLNCYYKGSEFFNLLRGLTFLPDSKNAYVVDSATGKKIFISLKVEVES